MQEGNELANNVTAVSAAVVGVLAMIAAVWAAAKKVYGIAKNIDSLVAASARHTKELAEIKEQVFANGGSTLRDVADRVESRLAKLESVPCPLHKDH